MSILSDYYTHYIQYKNFVLEIQLQTKKAADKFFVIVIAD